MLNFALCDDSKPTVDKLSELLESIFIQNKIDATVCFSCTNPDDLLEYNKSHDVNVFILDIDLKNKLSGIDLANHIREFNKDVYFIFITAHYEYVLLAYKCKTFDYITKPISKDKVEETIFRLMDDINGSNKKNSFIRINNKNTIINQDNINFIKRDGMKLVFYTDTRTYEVYSSFKKISNDLPSNFVRCHKSYIANIDKISDVQINNNIITFNNKNEVCYIGPKYKNMIMKVLNDELVSNNLDGINNRKRIIN